MNTKLAFITAVCLFLSACTLPATNVPPATTMPEILYTQAVETILARMTEEVATATSLAAQEPLLTNTLQPAATATQPPPAPIEASATATALPSATATLPPTQVPTLVPSDPRARLGEPAFRDALDSAENWPLYTDSHVSFEVKNGQLVMTAFNPDFYNGWMLSWINPEDFYLEITGTHGNCAGRDRFGVVFRAPDNNSGYLLGFSCDGRYSLWYWDGKKEVDIVDWEKSAFINSGPGQTNRLGVWAEGDRLALYANGNLLAEVFDSTSRQGKIGLFVGAADTQNYTASIDEIAYWNLK